MKGAAFFDVDNTLVDGNVSLIFASVYRKRGLISLPFLLKMTYFALLHKLNLFSSERFTKNMLSFLKGLEVEKERRFIHKNYGVVADKIVTVAIAELKRIKKDHKVVFLTSSIGMVVEPLAESLGVKDIICTRLEKKKGKLTGGIIEYCYSDHKKTMLVKYAKKKKIDLKVSYFYSDSYSDLPAFNAVGNPVAVNPDHKLKEYSKEKRWKIIES